MILGSHTLQTYMLPVLAEFCDLSKTVYSDERAILSIKQPYIMNASKYAVHRKVLRDGSQVNTVIAYFLDLHGTGSNLILIEGDAERLTVTPQMNVMPLEPLLAAATCTPV